MYYCTMYYSVCDNKIFVWLNVYTNVYKKHVQNYRWGTEKGSELHDSELQDSPDQSET